MEGIGEDFPTEWLDRVERVHCGESPEKLPTFRFLPNMEELSV